MVKTTDNLHMSCGPQTSTTNGGWHVGYSSTGTAETVTLSGQGTYTINGSALTGSWAWGVDAVS